MEILEALLISLNFLGLFFHALFELHSVVFHHLSLAFVVHPLHFVFEHLKLLILVGILVFLSFDSVSQLSNLELFLLSDVLGLIISILLHLDDLGL